MVNGYVIAQKPTHGSYRSLAMHTAKYIFSWSFDINKGGVRDKLVASQMFT